MTTYIGRRGWSDLVVMRKHGNKITPLPFRWDLVNHSPTGFEAGYGGSGPAQLALALLADATGDDQWARAHYQRFKWDVVAKLPWEWECTQEDVLAWVAAEKRMDEQEAHWVRTGEPEAP